MIWVEFDAYANILRICVSGFLKIGDVPALATVIEAKTRAALSVSDDFNVVMDLMEFPVQATDVTMLIGENMKGGIAVTSGRVAVAVGSQLGKLQLMRVFAHPRLQVFSSIEESLEWLAQKT